jgi:hypothetical protein
MNNRATGGMNGGCLKHGNPVTPRRHPGAAHGRAGISPAEHPPFAADGAAGCMAGAAPDHGRLTASSTVGEHAGRTAGIRRSGSASSGAAKPSTRPSTRLPRYIMAGCSPRPRHYSVRKRKQREMCGVAASAESNDCCDWTGTSPSCRRGMGFILKCAKKP